jgi:hypothetical protein
MATFRPYTDDEIRKAAEAYDLDPDFVQAVYAVESSRGTNPKAMSARSVKRKRDSTIVRGPFQLEDDTTSDLIKKHGLGDVNVDDPDTHLDLALRLMKDLKDQYGGDYSKVAARYLGTGTDELGTTTGAYSNKIMAEMAKRKGDGGQAPLSADEMDARLMGPPRGGSDYTPGIPDLFGVSASAHDLPTHSGTSWGDLVAANKSPSNQFALTDSMGGDLDMAAPQAANDQDIERYIQQLVDEELQGKDYASA